MRDRMPSYVCGEYLTSRVFMRRLHEVPATPAIFRRKLAMDTSISSILSVRVSDQLNHIKDMRSRHETQAVEITRENTMAIEGAKVLVNKTVQLLLPQLSYLTVREYILPLDSHDYEKNRECPRYVLALGRIEERYFFIDRNGRFLLALGCRSYKVTDPGNIHYGKTVWGDCLGADKPTFYRTQHEDVRGDVPVWAALSVKELLDRIVAAVLSVEAEREARLASMRNCREALQSLAT